MTECQARDPKVSDWTGIREGLPEEVTFELRAEWKERACHAKTGGKSIPGRVESRSKGPEVGSSLAYVSIRKKAGLGCSG